MTRRHEFDPRSITATWRLPPSPPAEARVVRQLTSGSSTVRRTAVATHPPRRYPATSAATRGDSGQLAAGNPGGARRRPHGVSRAGVFITPRPSLEARGTCHVTYTAELMTRQSQRRRRLTSDLILVRVGQARAERGGYV